jgi:hypothetical protein
MNKHSFIGFLTILIIGVAAVNAQESPVAITLERTPCFGSCPVYTVTLLENGTVLYSGENFVEVMGEQITEIDPAAVEQMVNAFENVGYFDWDEAYQTQTVSDLATVITSVTRGGETHRITRYAGDDTAPLALPFLENWIDTMANTALWTGVQPDPAAISNGTDTAFITMQQDACFGVCPVYSVALFEDGTVVYTGIAHVAEIGVHLIEIDGAALTIIPQQAQLFGYFYWQDSYQKQVMTDQLTVTTSIRWQDQSKRIVRYGGDPGAPVGLLWIEESITQFVSDLIG